MGMGEPLLNLRAVVAAVRFLNTAVGIGARHITISTVGVPQAIARLAAHRMQATLAVSVHAPSQALRQQLIPRRARAPCARPRPPRRHGERAWGAPRRPRSAKAYPLEALMADCRDFFAVTGRRVTFEYTLMAGVNDSPAQARSILSAGHVGGVSVSAMWVACPRRACLLLQGCGGGPGLQVIGNRARERGAGAQARELAALLERYDLRSHVNLIPWNPVADSAFRRPSRPAVAAFTEARPALRFTSIAPMKAPAHECPWVF